MSGGQTGYYCVMIKRQPFLVPVSAKAAK